MFRCKIILLIMLILINKSTGENNPDHIGISITKTGPRMMYRHFNVDNRFGYGTNLDLTLTDKQSSYKFDFGLLYTISKSERVRLFLSSKLDFDIHSQHLQEYYKGTVRDRTDTRMISSFINGFGITIGNYIPCTFESGFSLSGYTEFEDDFKYSGFSTIYSFSLAYAFDFRDVYYLIFGE